MIDVDQGPVAQSPRVRRDLSVHTDADLHHRANSIYAGSVTDTTTGSRRELNKERTRRAIRASVLQLACQSPIAELTAEQIADRAGISRRTFFNYYAGIDAVLAQATQEPMLGLFEAFLARPGDEDPLAAMIAALQGPLPIELAQWCAALSRPDNKSSEVYAQVWQRHTAWLAGVIHTRLGADADPLYVAGLAGSVMSLFTAAQDSWITRTQGRLDDASLLLFADLLRDALGHARAGWRAPRTTSRSAREHPQR